VSRTVPMAAAAVVVVLVAVVYTTNRNSDFPKATPESEDSLSLPAENDQVSDFSVALPEPATSADSEAAAATLVTESELDSNDTFTTLPEANDYAQRLAQSSLNDEAIEKITAELKQDPVLLSAVLDEFAIETDVERLSRLRLLLGQLDDDSLVAAAESMVYSGNPASADAALDLLRDIGARVPAARSVALDVLSSTQDPQTLVSASQVVNNPGNSDDEVRQRVVSTMSGLVQHLARWSTDPSVTPTLLQGLSDPDPSVRKSTAYGFVGYSHADASVVEALLITAENPQEIPRARQGAILALKGMSLDDTQTLRLQAAIAALS